MRYKPESDGYYVRSEWCGFDFKETRICLSDKLPEYSKYFKIYLHPLGGIDKNNIISLDPLYTKNKITKIIHNLASYTSEEWSFANRNVYITTDNKILTETGIYDTEYQFIPGTVETVNDFIAHDTISSSLIEYKSEIDIYYYLEGVEKYAQVKTHFIIFSFTQSFFHLLKILVQNRIQIWSK